MNFLILPFAFLLSVAARQVEAVGMNDVRDIASVKCLVPYCFPLDPTVFPWVDRVPFFRRFDEHSFALQTIFGVLHAQCNSVLQNTLYPAIRYRASG
jgi:hypothetical protein